MSIVRTIAVKVAKREAIRQLRKRRKALAIAGGIGAGLVAAEVCRRLTLADLTGDVAFITGSSRGLGFLLAREFARKGCKVVITARDTGELARARRDLEREGFEVLAVMCDVRDPADIERAVQRARERFGRIDILVNNAGVIQVGPVQSMTAQDFEEAMEVMFWGMLYPTLAVLPEMLERRRGRIVNITSIGGKVAVPHLLPYDCAKFAAVGLSEGLHAELLRDGIRVTTIVPGLMRTGSFLNAFFKGRQDREYVWFSLGATLPVISMDAERAARQIVRATRRGEAERVLSLPANMLARVHGVMPGVISTLLGIVNALMPRHPGGETAKARGAELHEQAQSRVLSAITRMGLKAADRYHEKPGPAAAA
jgi:NAD(P)-dependent dehydrogenase (short-subunit alcohol dehydrogenase family)